jgi:hypothetical protein
MTYIIPSDATWHKKQEYVWFEGGDLNILEIFGHLLFNRERDQVMTYIPTDAPWHKEQEYIQFRGWRIQ